MSGALNPFAVLVNRPKPGDLQAQVEWLQNAAAAFANFEAPAAHSIAEKLNHAVETIHEYVRRGKRLDPAKFNERFAALVEQVQALLVRFLHKLVSECERNLRQRTEKLKPGTAAHQKAQMATEAYLWMRQGIEHFVAFLNDRDPAERQRAVKLLRTAQQALSRAMAA